MLEEPGLRSVGSETVRTSPFLHREAYNLHGPSENALPAAWAT